MHPTALTKSNVLLSQPLPEWLSHPVLSRFENLGVFTEDEASETEEARTDDSVVNPSASTGTPHRAANHVLINEYPPGQGIMPHEDGAAYAPVVATVTLGSHCVLDLYEKRDLDETDTDGEDSTSVLTSSDKKQPRYRILQERCSLLVTRGSAYKSLIHGIADVHEDRDLDVDHVVNWHLLSDHPAYESGTKTRELRISLTFRDVIKVSNVGSRLFGKPKT